MSKPSTKHAVLNVGWWVCSVSVCSSCVLHCYPSYLNLLAKHVHKQWYQRQVHIIYRQNTSIQKRKEKIASRVCWVLHVVCPCPNSWWVQDLESRQVDPDNFLCRQWLFFCNLFLSCLPKPNCDRCAAGHPGKAGIYCNAWTILVKWLKGMFHSVSSHSKMLTKSASLKCLVLLTLTSNPCHEKGSTVSKLLWNVFKLSSPTFFTHMHEERMTWTFGKSQLRT